jgi:hypothetical protein
MGIEVIIGIDVKRTIGFLIGKHLIRTYCCRSRVKFLSCPMVRVCLLSNIYCTISCSIKGCLIMTFFNTIKCFHVASIPSNTIPSNNISCGLISGSNFDS